MRAKRMRLLPIAVLVLASYGTAWAQQSPAVGTGLGQSWPNASDVSSSPHWHVYIFEREGIRYLQVNDLNGNVRSAFATAQEQFLILPSGVDAGLATVGHIPSAGSASQTVYDDGTVRVTVHANNRGLVWDASPAHTTAPTNGIQSRSASMSDDCNDPEKCSSQITK